MEITVVKQFRKRLISYGLTTSQFVTPKKGVLSLSAVESNVFTITFHLFLSREASF